LGDRLGQSRRRFLLAQLPFAGVVFALDGVLLVAGGHLVGTEHVHCAAADFRRVADGVGPLGSDWDVTAQK
jgi:hypothetical protein